MTRRLFLPLLALLCAAPSFARQQVFARAYDLSVPTVAATTNYIVTSVNLTSTSFTLAHQPDVPRNFTGTVTDTTPSVVAGTVTFTGTDVNDAAQTEVWDFATALTFTGTKLFKTLTSATAAGVTVLGGAGDETIIIGVGSTVGYIYCATGDYVVSPARVKSTASSTTVTTINSASAFGGLTIGDEIFAQVNGSLQRRVITAIASSTSVTVDSAVSWANSGAGYPMQSRHRVCGYADTSGWIAVNSSAANNVKVELGTGDGTALTATGGLDVSVECRLAEDDGAQPAQVIGVNMTSTLKPLHSQLLPVTENCSSMRVGVKWGTVDTSGTDSVSAYLVTGVLQ